MQTFNSGFFWFVEGILFVVMILGVRALLQDRGAGVAFWKWGIFVAWVVVGGFTIAFVGTSLGEGEPVAAQRGGLLFGLLTIISGVGVWRLLLSGPTTDGGEVAEGD